MCLLFRVPQNRNIRQSFQTYADGVLFTVLSAVIGTNDAIKMAVDETNGAGSMRSSSD
jgi:hypothetical protein